MKIYGFILLFLLTAVLTNFMSLVRLNFSAESSVISRDMPVPQTPLKLYGADGFLELPDKPAMIVFFGSWCKPCLLELPVLAELAKRKDLPFIGIALRDKPEKIKKLFEKVPNPFDAIALDDGSDWARDLRALTIPSAFITNGKGLIVYEISGVLTPEFYMQNLLGRIQELTDEKHP